MAELLTEHLGQLLTLFGSIAATAWGAIKWFGSRLLNQHDELTKRVDKLERDYVTRNELDELRKELRQNNKETTDRLDKILHLLVARDR